MSRDKQRAFSEKAYREIIVVDDGSKDRSKELIQEQFGSRVTVIFHDSNQGISAARRTGYLAARGEWIAYLDSDDLWPQDALETLFKQALPAHS